MPKSTFPSHARDPTLTWAPQALTHVPAKLTLPGSNLVCTGGENHMKEVVRTHGANLGRLYED